MPRSARSWQPMSGRRRPRQLVDVPMPARCRAMQSSPAVSRVCGVNASLTLASDQSKMSDNARITAARIANIAIPCRRAEDGSGGAHLTLHVPLAQGRPDGRAHRRSCRSDPNDDVGAHTNGGGSVASAATSCGRAAAAIPWIGRLLQPPWPRRG
jgi:hypothetical protein